MSCKPLNFLYKEIKSLGYITYTTPLRDAGPGTLLGGNPKGLKLVGDFLDKSVLKPNNIKYPPTRLDFVNLFK